MAFFNEVCIDNTFEQSNVKSTVSFLGWVSHYRIAKRLKNPRVYKGREGEERGGGGECELWNATVWFLFWEAKAFIYWRAILLVASHF